MNIALLTYHFYNSTAEGLVTAKVARALVDRGHRVVVITSCLNPLEGDRVAPDSGPLRGLIIHRVPEDITIIPWWWKALDRRSGRGRIWSKIAAIPNLIYGCSYHDWAWIENASRKVVHLHKTGAAFDILHTRLNHFTSHLAGLQTVKRLPRLPWCAYFSDPWPHHLYPEPYRSHTIGAASRIRLERLLYKILKKAGSTLFPGERLRDYILSGPRERFRARSFAAPHLSNIWDPARLPARTDSLRIRHSGFLMRERKIEPLYKGLRAFLEEESAARGHLRVEFAGRYQDNTMPEAPGDLGDVVQFHPYMTPEAVASWMQEADVFLLVEAKMKEGVFFASKLADYLGGGRPILALSPQVGVTADFLRNGGGLLVEPDDVIGVRDSLHRLYSLWKEDRLQELAPPPEQAAVVSPGQVMPVYEEAFCKAMKG